jgi:uncharacterized protein (DUF427 family)
MVSTALKQTCYGLNIRTAHVRKVESTVIRRIQRIEPGPGQESVWDYPRPPRVEESDRHIRVIVAETTIADTHRSKRVLETSHPPTYYIPAADVRMDLLRRSPGTTWCEWKGAASYYDVVVGDRIIPRAAWTYLDPVPQFEGIRDHIAFYASRVDQCLVDDEVVITQEGDFYGGWITSDVVGPFKGAVGTRGW